ncbi:MAG: hypothetical protein GY940_43365 [bacterium]|nr:hypothetical protein [bacterium]
MKNSSYLIVMIAAGMNDYISKSIKMKGDREKCLEAGMNDYISKPIKREVVFEVVMKWCRGKV